MSDDSIARPEGDRRSKLVPVAVAAFILAAGILTAVLIHPSHRQVCTRETHGDTVAVSCTGVTENRIPLRIGVVVGAAALALFEVAFESRAARRSA